MDASAIGALDRIVDDTGFSGVVRVTRDDVVVYERAAGLADRAHGIANTLGTRFGIASGAKGLTALAVMALVADGSLSLEAPVRALLGDPPELARVDAAVTVERLLAHTSGIGDYLPEEGDIDDHALSLPVHQLASPRDFLPLLAGHPMVRPPGEQLEYCNGGYVLLALVIEAAAGRGYHDVVAERVLKPAGMTATEFLRMDSLPGDVAIGYLGGDPESLRTNVLHLPVRGLGDGGAFSTLDDVARFWAALFAGRIVPSDVVEEMVRPRNSLPDGSLRSGLGFWMPGDGDTVRLEGYDAGTSFRTAQDRDTGMQYTVMSNTSGGAWPLVKLLDEHVTA
jgi:CubicO group peptidase (beta-lactamase class C family)